MPARRLIGEFGALVVVGAAGAWVLLLALLVLL